MSNVTNTRISRRAFVRRGSAIAGSIAVGAGVARPCASQEPAVVDAETARLPWPKRTLGRTGISLTTLTLGTAPCGLSPEIPPPEIADIVNFALDQGITSIDTAPAYIQSEEGIGLALGKRRKEVFLATKVLADTVKEAQESLDKSFKLLKTDWIDLVYYHSAGDHDVERAMAPDGVFTWLVKQKKAGRFRFLGISGHNRPPRFVPLLETDEVDVLLTVVNFVDRHTYRFEEKVLPVAQRHGTGIVAMKVFGGARKSAGSYKNPNAPPELDTGHLSLAVRYALGVPGVATLNLGVHNKQQVAKNVAMVKRFEPLSADEQAKITKLGQELAQTWGPHFGPVA